MKTLTRREKVYVGVFVVALLWGLWNFRGYFGGPEKSAQAPPPRPAAAAVMPEAHLPPVSVPATAADAPTPDHTPPDWGPNPFYRPWRHAPAATAAPTRSGRLAPLRLTAVAIQGDVRYAVINGRVVREGETIEGRRVLRVEESRVLVDEKGVEVTLSL